MDQLINRKTILLPVVMMLVALAPLPYGYYMLLRVVVCFFAAIIAYALWETDGAPKWLFAGMAVLFNPLVPVHLGEAILWAPFNVGGAALFMWFREKKRA